MADAARRRRIRRAAEAGMGYRMRGWQRRVLGGKVMEAKPKSQDGGGGAVKTGQQKRYSGGRAAEAERWKRNSGCVAVQASEAAELWYRELGGQ